MEDFPHAEPAVPGPGHPPAQASRLGGSTSTGRVTQDANLIKASLGHRNSWKPLQHVLAEPACPAQSSRPSLRTFSPPDKMGSFDCPEELKGRRHWVMSPEPPWGDHMHTSVLSGGKGAGTIRGPQSKSPSCPTLCAPCPLGPHLSIPLASGGRGRGGIETKKTTIRDTHTHTPP